ncbi:uncharacterized protein A4U43_C07F19230 [Asparagus officinalis]|uniref:Uncharacterized protein n=1 Tax=Asparagus officinalis TaxID=4686 RepID=A0A5P1ED49_ASPOF|nr:uncharacterized protein A4U43_C07F19230 [Asparagus officinalis]
MITQLVQNQGVRCIEPERKQTIIENIKQLEMEEDKALERFLKFNQPKFLGDPEDEKARLRLKINIESIFITLHYDKEKKVSYVVFQLQGASCIHVNGEGWLMKNEHKKIHHAYGQTLVMNLMMNIFPRLLWENGRKNSSP